MWRICSVWKCIVDLIYKLIGWCWNGGKQAPEDEEETENLALVTQAMTPLVASGFLTEKELGRFVLLTSKKLGNAAFVDVSNNVQERREYFWKSLCVARWNLDDTTALQAGLSPLSFEDCFRLIALWGEQNYRPPRKSPKFNFRSMLPYCWGPQANPKDYKIVLASCELKSDGKYHQVPVIVINGEEFADFFERGSVSMKHAKPICTGEYGRHAVQVPLTKVYFVRVSDRRVLPLYLFENSYDIVLKTESGEEIEGSRLIDIVSPTNSYADGLFRARLPKGNDGLVIAVDPCCVLKGPGSRWEIYGFRFEMICQTPRKYYLFDLMKEKKLGWLKPAHFFEALMDEIHLRDADDSQMMIDHHLSFLGMLARQMSG